MFKKFNIKTKVYIIFVYLVSLLLLIQTYKEYTLKISLLCIVFFTILSFVAESLTVSYNGVSVCTGYTIILTSIVLFGPKAAIIIVCIGTMLRVYKVNGRYKSVFNVPLYKTLFNMSVMLISIVLSTKVYEFLGGIYYNFYTSLIPILCMSLVFLILDYLLVYFLVHLISGENLLLLISRNTSMALLNFVAMLPLGIIIAMGFKEFSYLGVIVVFGPILLARYSFVLYANMKESYLDTVRALSMAVEAKDRYTEGHSARVVGYAEKIGIAMMFSENHLENLKIASLLHDIGKIGIPETILNKPGSLSDEEYDVIKSHPVIGANIIKDVNHLKGVANIVKYHHEHYDGSGYPEGLKGDKIPLDAAIISVADAYDAMCSDRPYRKAMPREKAMSILREERGKQFNPKVVDVFLKILSSQRS